MTAPWPFPRKFFARCAICQLQAEISYSKRSTSPSKAFPLLWKKRSASLSLLLANSGPRPCPSLLALGCDFPFKPRQAMTSRACLGSSYFALHDMRLSRCWDSTATDSQNLTGSRAIHNDNSLFLLSCHISDPPSHEFAKPPSCKTVTTMILRNDSHDDSVQ